MKQEVSINSLARIFFIFSARDQLDTWTLALQKTRDMVVVESSALVLKSECADILHQSFLRMLRQVEELPNNNSETAVYGHTPALL